MRRGFARFRRTHEFRLLVVTLALVVFLGLATPSFLSVQNALNLMTSYAFRGILAVGLLVVLIAGGIDISFTASASVAQYVAVAAANAYGLGWVETFAIGAAVGTALGLVNAVLVSTLRISSIIVSIATLNVFYGLLVFVTRGQYIYTLPGWFANGIDWVLYTDAAKNQYAINLQMAGLVAMFALTWVLLNRTNTGRQIYALGGNPDAAGRVGFNVFRLNLLVYGYLGFAAGIASLVVAQYEQSVAPTALVGKELDVLAAVVLGGASLTGGTGSVLGTALGLALLAIMQNGLILLGVSSYWSEFFTGLVILVAVAAIAWEKRRGQAGRRVAA